MNLTFEVYDEAPTWWDQEVLRNTGLFCASSKWADFHKTLGISTSKYLVVKQGKKRLMLLLINDMLLEGHYYLHLPKALLRLLATIPFFRTYYFYLQPTLITKNCKRTVELEEISIQVLTFLYELAKKEHRNIHPSVFIGLPTIDSVKNVIAHFNASFTVAGTTRIPLTTVEKMYTSLPEDVRYKIQKARKMGVTIKFIDTEDTPLYSQAQQASYEAYGLRKYPTAYDYVLKKCNPDAIQHMVAEINGHIVGGEVVMRLGTTVMEGGYITPYARQMKISAGDLLKWEAIRYSISKGCTLMELNMIDVSSDADEVKTKTISYFKLKWGGPIIYGVKISHLNPLFKTIRSVNEVLHNKRYLSLLIRIFPGKALFQRLKTLPTLVGYGRNACFII